METGLPQTCLLSNIFVLRVMCVKMYVCASVGMCVVMMRPFAHREDSVWTKPDPPGG